MHPNDIEVIQIYHMWKEAFQFDDDGSIDDYFARNFRKEHCYILKENDTIIATLCAHPHMMILNDKEIPVLFISGVITAKPYRQLGFMKKLFTLVFQAHPDCPLWLLQAYQPAIYKTLGFQESHHQMVYTYKHTHPCTMSVVTDLQKNEMVLLANQFLSNYNCYIKRDEVWYENYIQEASALNQKLYGIRQQEKLLAYAKYDPTQKHIDELFYLDDESRRQLLAYITKNDASITVDSYVPLQDAVLLKTQTSLMIRSGNIDTLKDIMQLDLQSLDDAFQTTTPLYHYGFW